MHPFPNRWTNYFHSDATVHIDRMNILHPWISWSSSALLLKWADWYLQMWNDKHKFTGRFRERSHFRAQGESTIFGWPAHVLLMFLYFSNIALSCSAVYSYVCLCNYSMNICLCCHSELLAISLTHLSSHSAWQKAVTQ